MHFLREATARKTNVTNWQQIRCHWGGTKNIYLTKKKKKVVLANLQSNDLQALGNSELVHAEYCDMILYDFKVMFIYWFIKLAEKYTLLWNLINT